MAATFSFAGVNLGIVSSVNPKVSGNLRDRTGISDPEMMYAGGKVERSIDVEIVGSLANVSPGQIGDAQLVGEGGQTRTYPRMIIEDIDETVDVGDGDGAKFTLKKARPA